MTSCHASKGFLVKIKIVKLMSVGAGIVLGLNMGISTLGFHSVLEGFFGQMNWITIALSLVAAFIMTTALATVVIQAYTKDQQT